LIVRLESVCAFVLATLRPPKARPRPLPDLAQLSLSLCEVRELGLKLAPIVLAGATDGFTPLPLLVLHGCIACLGPCVGFCLLRRSFGRFFCFDTPRLLAPPLLPELFTELLLVHVSNFLLPKNDNWDMGANFAQRCHWCSHRKAQKGLQEGSVDKAVVPT
jgi:hypothetical protein